MDTQHRPQLARVLGLSDLSFFLIAALVNLNSIPVVAGAGPVALVLWGAGFVFFFLPQAVAVLELSHRYPQEGGIYRWTRTAFGDFHGFFSGWCYWTNNIFYVPTLLFYIVGFAAFIGGDATAGLSSSPLFMVTVSLALLWIITGLNVRGLGVGKWVQTVGAGGTFITTALILTIGVVSVNLHGMANAFSASSLAPALNDWRLWSLASVVCLNYVGLELAAILGEEVREPRRVIPRAVIIAGSSTVLLYLLATFALQATIPASEIGVLDGILQGVRKAATDVHLPWLVLPIALLMSLNAAGNTSAWLAGAARIPFVIGIDRYLPAAFGRIHPRFHTPHVALVVQGFASSLFIILSAIGSSVREMYMILLQTTVILQLIPYLYMFAALLRLQRIAPPGGEVFFRSRSIRSAAGIVGFAVTGVGIVLALLPPAGVEDLSGFEVKLGLGALSFLIPALLVFARQHRRLRLTPMVPREVEIAPD